MSNKELVLVAGATGGVGQLIVGKLLEKGLKVRVLTRSADKAEKMFGNRVEIVVGDIRHQATLPSAVQDITHIICCTGTTAFPSGRWEFNVPQNSSPLEWINIYLSKGDRYQKAKNSPFAVDAEGVKNLVAAAPRSLERFILVSSCGVLHKEQLPYNLLNAFGVLDAKKIGEDALITSGLPYTIIRPGRLIDGPYTSYDLNTLLKSKTDGKLAVVIGTGDNLLGQTSRIDVASACVECIFEPITEGKVFEMVNQGTRPSVIDWKVLFSQLS